MKKNLLSSLALAAVFSVNAQDYVAANGFKEDFAGADKVEDKYSDREIFWYGCGVTAEPTDETCYSADHDLTRNGDGDLTIATTKPLAGGNWAPVGFSLVNADHDQTVDISSTSEISVSYTNTSSNNVEVYWTFVSKENSTAAQAITMADGTGSSFGGLIAVGETKDLTFNLSTGTRTSWELSEEQCTAKDGMFSSGKCIWEDGFMANKLFAVEIAITGEATAESSWAPAALNGETVVFHHITGGEDVSSSNETVVTGFNVYPNPATDALNVKFDANAVTTVELTDLTGKVVETQTAQAGASTVNFATANVNAGVYFVNVKNVNGSTTQKVVIK